MKKNQITTKTSNMESNMIDLEAVRLQPSDESIPAPVRPLYFDYRYELPMHRVKLLEKVNPHPRDDRIVFYEEPHVYTIDGKPAQCSVSGLAAEFESEFDPIKSINGMKRSRNCKWPRLQYVINAQKVTNIDDLDGNLGCMLVDATNNNTVGVIEPGVAAGESGIVILTILRDQMSRKICEDKEEWYTFDRVCTDDEICHMWEVNGEDARNRGTEAHLQMELWMNSEPVRLDDGEVKVGLAFVRDCLIPLQAKAFRTEWTIFGEEENVAGCIDLALEIPNGDIFLVDWKRSEKLKTKMFGYSPMSSPMSHLDDCSGSAYALQLSCYQYIIEKYYGRRVTGRALASIHPEKPFTTAVPYLKEEVEYIMARRSAMANVRKSLSEQDVGKDLLCTKSGEIVMDAFIGEDGKLYDQKMAKLHDIKGNTNKEITTRAKQLINEHMPFIHFAGGKTNWKELFSPTGDLLNAYRS